MMNSDVTMLDTRPAALDYSHARRKVANLQLNVPRLLTAINSDHFGTYS